jgi:SAM-dependent methyltransferase
MKEAEIRPDILLGRYLSLSEADATRFFSKGAGEIIACVACKSDDTNHALKKGNFSYSHCGECGTLYLNPRPTLLEFEAFYQDSESAKYWAEVFFPAVAEARREKIFRPRVDRLVLLCDEKRISLDRLVDVGAGFGIFLDEWRQKLPGTELLAIEPSTSLSEECRKKGFNVVQSIVENMDSSYEGYADLVTCFEVLEHVHDPMAFLKHLKRLCRPGGYVFISTLCIDGFDLQTLWSKSQQISPPHHINFLSIRGFEELFTRAGFVDISISTPGRLDVDIVRNATLRDPDILRNQPFIKGLLRDESTSAAFQVFLVENCLSSHAWVLAQVPSHST